MRQLERHRHRREYNVEMDFNPLTPELNPFRLPRFFTGDFKFDAYPQKKKPIS